MTLTEPRTWRALGGLIVVTLALSGCGFVAKEALQVVMKIGEDVIVTTGAQYVQKLVDGSGDPNHPTIKIDYQDSSQHKASVTYAVDAPAVSVSGIEGSVEITGNGNETTVRVEPPSTATIEITGAGQVASTTNVASPLQTAQESITELTNAANILSGTWQGKYRCQQGLTGLRLVLYPTNDGILLGTFSFYAADSNPGIPSGQFAMRGTYSESQFVLKADYWIDQPSGYGMIDISGNIPAGLSSHLAGQLSGSCNTYDLAKTSTKTSKPPV